MVFGGRREQGELEVSEERFRLLVENVVDYAIYMLDPDGTVMTWNTGVGRLKGYSKEDIVGRHYSTFYTEEDRAARLPERLLAEAREHGRVEHSGWRVRKDGTRFWADVVITALRTSSGELTGYAKITRDMTEPHRTAEAREQVLQDQRRNLVELEQIDRWRRDFVGSILHDLQAPVLAIGGFAELLAEAQVDPDALEDVDVSEFPERILSNVRALRGLIDHLRSFTLLESGGITLALEPIELRPFLDRLVADLAPVLDGHPVGVEVRAERATADRGGLERILSNLLTNAARHTPDGAPIQLGVEQRDGHTVFEVTDEGQGIDAELLPTLFQQFSHGGKGGTGLGLTIVKQYVELHGGEVTVDSAPGQGATFRVTLPAS